MLNEQTEGFENEKTEVIEPEFLTTLAETCLNDREIRQELEQKGFKQFYPGYVGFSFDTIPPGLSAEQYEQWQLKEQQRRVEYIDNMDPLKKERISNENTAYEQTLNYLKHQVLFSLDLLNESKYGLKDFFNKAIIKDPIDTIDIINTMKNHDINVLEYPNQEIGFDGKDNHGESKYVDGKWNVKLNKIALSDPTEILHELIGIESFDCYLRNKPSFRETLSTLPIGLFVMTMGKSAQESIARGQYNRKHMMTIPILESLYKTVNSYKAESPFLNRFSNTIKK